MRKKDKYNLSKLECSDIDAPPRIPKSIFLITPHSLDFWIPMTPTPPPPFWIDIITAVPPYADLQIVFRAKFLPLTLLPLTQILNYIFLFLPAPITPSSEY